MDDFFPFVAATPCTKQEEDHEADACAMPLRADGLQAAAGSRL